MTQIDSEKKFDRLRLSKLLETIYNDHTTEELNFICNQLLQILDNFSEKSRYEEISEDKKWDEVNEDEDYEILEDEKCNGKDEDIQEEDEECDYALVYPGQRSM